MSASANNEGSSSAPRPGQRARLVAPSARSGSCRFRKAGRPRGDADRDQEAPRGTMSRGRACSPMPKIEAGIFGSRSWHPCSAGNVEMCRERGSSESPNVGAHKGRSGIPAQPRPLRLPTGALGRVGLPADRQRGPTQLRYRELPKTPTRRLLPSLPQFQGHLTDRSQGSR